MTSGDLEGIDDDARSATDALGARTHSSPVTTPTGHPADGPTEPDATTAGLTPDDLAETASADASDSIDLPEQQDLPPWLFRTLMVLIAGVFISSWIGDAVFADWIDSHPLALTALNARDRILLLTVNKVEPWEFFLVAGIRSIVFDPVFYLLGWFYGERSLAWLKARSGSMSTTIETFEELFPWLGYPMLVISPGVHLYVLAGVTRMNRVGFAFVTVFGTFARLTLIFWLGDRFEDQLEWLTGQIGRFRLPIIILSVLAVFYTIAKEYRNSRSLRS